MNVRIACIGLQQTYTSNMVAVTNVKIDDVTPNWMCGFSCKGLVSESSSEMAQTWEVIGDRVFSGVPRFPLIPPCPASSTAAFFRLPSWPWTICPNTVHINRPAHLTSSHTRSANSARSSDFDGQSRRKQLKRMQRRQPSDTGSIDVTYSVTIRYLKTKMLYYATLHSV